jgi:hypothetical protein
MGTTLTLTKAAMSRGSRELDRVAQHNRNGSERAMVKSRLKPEGISPDLSIRITTSFSRRLDELSMFAALRFEHLAF